ncbi:MAG: carboxylate-amine ligase, partial [Gloeomargaritaceae cyanobacterium C42_A2020_066]|nr:carboxylate-amine ligase [Gloeomargaritaceae cyanobacterium C42_A2020_066]
MKPGGVEDQFYRLQAKLGERQAPGWDQGDQDIVVVPSLSVDQRELLKISGFLHYEERQLFHLIQLRQPRTRLVYITSTPLHPSIIEYYLQLLPGIPFSHARDRLLVLSVYDASPSPLTQKILERPRLIEQIRQAIRPERAWLTAYNATDLEQTLSVALGIPFLGPAAALQCWGTKRGSRQIFAECGIPHPVGTELYHDPGLLAEALVDLWQQAPHLRRWVVKLNAGFSGEGNALLDLDPLQLDSLDTPTQQVQAVLQGFTQMRFQAPGETWLGFCTLMAEMGALAERFLEGDEKRSPSVQGLIHPGGRVEVLSTHEQILGGPDGQVYLGCRFPADAAYRATLHTLGLQVGEALARRGAIERYGVDFLVRRDPDSQTWDVQALEINLRQGGTTHPLMTLKLLTNGQY